MLWWKVTKKFFGHSPTISGHVLGIRERGIGHSVLDYIVGMRLGQNGFYYCFKTAMHPHIMRTLMYKNQDGVIRGSLRGYLKDRNMFIHCAGAGQISLRNTPICEGFTPRDIIEGHDDFKNYSFLK